VHVGLESGEEYSDAIPIVGVGSTSFSIKRGSLLLEFGVEIKLIQAVEEHHIFTRVIEVTPKLIISNDSDFPLELK
jgi:hypothetical protein